MSAPRKLVPKEAESNEFLNNLCEEITAQKVVDRSRISTKHLKRLSILSHHLPQLHAPAVTGRVMPDTEIAKAPLTHARGTRNCG